MKRQTYRQTQIDTDIFVVLDESQLINMRQSTKRLPCKHNKYQPRKENIPKICLFLPSKQFPLNLNCLLEVVPKRARSLNPALIPDAKPIALKLLANRQISMHAREQPAMHQEGGIACTLMNACSSECVCLCLRRGGGKLRQIFVSLMKIQCKCLLLFFTPSQEWMLQFT